MGHLYNKTAAAMHNKNNGTLRPKTTSPGSNTVMNMNAYKLYKYEVSYA